MSELLEKSSTAANTIDNSVDSLSIHLAFTIDRPRISHYFAPSSMINCSFVSYFNESFLSYLLGAR